MSGSGSNDGPMPDGIRDGRPGRQAAAGVAARPRRRVRGEGAEQLMSPPAKFGSYYGRPVIKAPVWEARDIAGYLYLGGLAGAASVLAAGAQLTGRQRLATTQKAGALGAISLSLVALVHDLGRPARFVNMLRVFKPTSPMNVGSWLLAGYGPTVGVAALTAATGRLPRIGAAATGAAALLGPAVASYTAVLISDTAVPAWHEGYREMPFVFVGSGATAAAGLGLLAAPTGQAAPARRAAAIGGGLEVLALRLMRRRLGSIARPYEQGRGGALLRAGEALTTAGAAGGLLFGRLDARAGRGGARRWARIGSAVSGAALLAGSACARFGIFQAGVDSANDPEHTVVPQRERLTARANAAATPSDR